MKQQKMILLLVLIAMVLIIFLTAGIGYASVTGNGLEIHDDFICTPEQGNFRVKFTGKPKYTGNGRAILKITGPTTATMDVEGLKKAGDSITASFAIENTSDDISAKLTRSVSNSNNKYFKVTATLKDDKLKPRGEKTILIINVELIKTPVEEVTTNLSVSVVAKPNYYEH